MCPEEPACGFLARPQAEGPDDLRARIPSVAGVEKCGQAMPGLIKTLAKGKQSLSPAPPVSSCDDSQRTNRSSR